MREDVKKLLDGLSEFVDWDTIREDERILLESLRDVCRKLKVNVEIDINFINELRKKFYEKFYELLREELRVRKELCNGIPLKQVQYLSALVFVEELLNNPVPAPLVFEVLRCIGVEENGNNPNKYYYLRQLKARGLVEEKTSAKSEAEYFYSATELGKKIAKSHAFFNELVEVKEKILNDKKVRRLIEIYSQQELNAPIVPNLIRKSKVVKEDERGIRVKLYDGKSYINVTWAELEQMDSVAKELRTFSHLELMKKSNMSDFKARAYLVYAYERGLIDVVDKVGPKIIYQRLNVD